MKPQFSEFSYGFAYTDALIRRIGGISAAPVFPSLRDEATKGWDVRLNYPGFPVFLQFKLSDRLERTNAKYWPYYRKPYFRIDITPLTRSRQHNLLKKLADSGVGRVSYEAPLFYQTREFDDAYISGKIIDRSISIPVSRLDYLTDNEAHYITFVGPSNPSWHTDEQNLEDMLIEGDCSAQQVYEGIHDMFNQVNIQIRDAEYFTELRSTLVNILSSTLNYIDSTFSTSRAIDHQMDDPLSRVMWDIRYLLPTYFGLEMFMLYEN